MIKYVTGGKKGCRSFRKDSLTESKKGNNRQQITKSQCCNDKVYLCSTSLDIQLKNDCG